jgi:hypothetical protein
MSFSFRVISDAELNGSVIRAVLTLIRVLMTDSSDDSPKKRKRSASGSLQDVLKFKRNMGEDFVTHRGKPVEKKRSGPSCECKKCAQLTSAVKSIRSNLHQATNILP